MIVLRKKRLIFILSCLVFSIFAFCLSQNNSIKNEKTVDTVSLPVSNKVIVIDARAWNSRERELLINPNQIITDLIQFKESV